ncbi:MAG TPA: hypothetical protein DF296_14405 [Candidatus Margulisbacteria bacterium]|nr:MAG: hypothetical protein A2X43_13975 [Candidatus Margulisbacteria bacterium GWD2_39_127]OGI02280.1 MAG: hypothetical protein A2X42_13040 [Candidatus Margulisbacteria bacterium GWF2_38_17]OGI11530.1 MAG: hypothetical protein A2X41_02685 [Candidatus Margulisbacteria bacterium GWE2_39_32]HAR63752.1 hypothetical protein [Candidatus Margulisiibacteriota bacterium]HCT86379.1 hypothetical protein [Candidatus Margulisiibacteriota bacterium]
MPVIELKKISKSYKSGKEEFFALKNISLTIEQGEYLSIVGTSGSGKSTLMNILGCLDPVQSGQYILNGKNISQYSETDLAKVRNEEIGFIFQSYNLLPKKTLIENTELPLIYKNIKKKKRRELSIDILTILGLGDRLNHLPGGISGGQRQRVAIARCLVNNPKVILADEPTGNLDSVTQLEIIELFREVKEKFNTTIIIVTHDEEVANFSDRVITLFDGKIYADINITAHESAIEANQGVYNYDEKNEYVEEILNNFQSTPAISVPLPQHNYLSSAVPIHERPVPIDVPIFCTEEKKDTDKDILEKNNIENIESLIDNDIGKEQNQTNIPNNSVCPVKAAKYVRKGNLFIPAG